MQSETSQAIIKRFFEAVDVLIQHKKIRGRQTYCNLYEIDKRNFYKQKHDLSRGYFEVSWLVPLVNDFNISSHWLMTGRGEMFK